jgi:glycosyltransferase involved in cell wall biosynthesis
LPPLHRLDSGLPLLHPAESIWLTSVIARRRPRLFYSPGYNAPPTCPVPFVFTVFDLIHIHIDEYRTVGRRLYYAAHVKPAIKRARAVLTGSNYSRASIVEWSGVDPDRVVVIGGAAGEEFTPAGEVHRLGYPYVLYVGNRKPHKNLARLISAFAHVEERSELKLVFSGPTDEGLIAMARNAGVHDRIAFLGNVPASTLPAVYRGAVALIFPSLYEGFGLPPLEAMACGTPVVSSLATSLAEVVGHAAVAIDPLDVDSIAAGIDKVVRDEQLRRDLRVRGFAQAGHFSWERSAQRTWTALQAGLDDS